MFLTKTKRVTIRGMSWWSPTTDNLQCHAKAHLLLLLVPKYSLGQAVPSFSLVQGLISLRADFNSCSTNFKTAVKNGKLSMSTHSSIFNTAEEDREAYKVMTKDASLGAWEAHFFISFPAVTPVRLM